MTGTPAPPQLCDGGSKVKYSTLWIPEKISNKSEVGWGRILDGADAEVTSMQLLTGALDPALTSDSPPGPPAGKKAVSGVLQTSRLRKTEQLFWCLKSLKFSHKITQRALHNDQASAAFAIPQILWKDSQ